MEKNSSKAIKNHVPRGIRNNNPLNIRVGNNWQGEKQPNNDGVFEQFRTMTDGCRAAAILAVNIITGRAKSCLGKRYDTLGALITKWAPPSENNTTAYIKKVCEITKYDEYKKLYPVQKHVLCFVLWAMAQVECGEVVPLHYFENGYSLAFPSTSKR